MDIYDLVVIGTGSAARAAATQVRGAGRSVAVIDHHPFGGTCPLRGCDPKKVLLSGAEAVDWARRMQRNGATGEISVTWKELIAFKRTFTGPVPKTVEQRFAEQGISAFRGTARFIGPDAIAVGDRTLRARKILIATGARPVPLGFFGAEHAIFIDAFMELEYLPARIVMVGGGYIAAEFSQIAARAGAKVTVLQRGARILPRFDADLVGWLTEGFRALGIDVRTNNAVTGIEHTGHEFRVHAQTPEGTAVISADLVVHAAGRVPDLADLDLAAGTVDAGNGRLRLNDYLQSVSNPIVYAAGDAASHGPALTPVSRHDGKIVAKNMLDGNRHRPDYRSVPSVVFTLPPIAAVGLSEADARLRAHRLRVRSAEVPNWFTSRRLGGSVYGYKTLVDADSGRIMGAHLVGPHADEVINVFALAIRHNLTADDLKTAMFAYPTATSDIASML